MHRSMRQTSRGLILALGLAAASPAVAQPIVVVQFNFNAGTSTPNVNNSTGTPNVVNVGTPTSSFTSAPNPDNGAGSSDPVPGSIGYQLTNYPTQGAGSGSTGVQFNTPTTNSFSNLVLRFDQLNSGDAPRHFQLQYTTDGTNYVPLTTYV